MVETKKPSQAWAEIEPRMREAFVVGFSVGHPDCAHRSGEFADAMVARVRLRACNADAGNCRTFRGLPVVDIDEMDVFEVELQMGFKP